MIRFALVLVLAACGGPQPAPAHHEPPPSPEAAKLDAAIEQTIKGHDMVGLSVAVARGDRIVLAKGYGFADLARHVAATPDTVYRIGSVTKQFTAVAILQLVERGRLALGDDLRKYLPDYPAHDTPITIEHLLTHTSGIFNYTEVADWIEVGKQPLTRADLVATFSGKPLEFTPGERWRYSNSNYYLLGLIIEKLENRPYADVIRDRVLRPAGMTASGYCDAAMPHHAEGYSFKDGKPPVIAPPIAMANPYAAGALCSTVLDLLKWQRALDAGKLLRPDSLARMRKDFALSTGKPAGYGYGLFVGELAGHPRIFHGGGINGFSAELSRFPGDDLTIVVLANAAVDTPHHVDERIARTALGLPEPAVKREALTGAQRARYLGSYELTGIGKNLAIRVFEEGDALRTQATGQPAATLLYQGHDTFVLDEDPSVELVFAKDGTRAPGFTLHQGGLAIEAKRSD